MSGTSDRMRRTNDPSSDRPRACCASRIAPARVRIRGTSWTADRTTNAIRWLAPRAMSDSSRSSASVVNRNVTEARNATRTRPAEMSPNVSPSRVIANGPSETSTSFAAGKNRLLTTRIESSRTAGMRIARRSGRSRPVVHAATRIATARTGRTSGGSRNAASRTRPRARSLVSGLRRCSQLDPAT